MFRPSSLVISLTSLLQLHVISCAINFEKLTLTKYFIDKSDILNVFFDDNVMPYYYLTYPNGFGKSVNLQLIKLFSQIAINERGDRIHYRLTPAGKVFAETKMNRAVKAIDEHMCRHPVIHLKFTKLRNLNEVGILHYLNERLYTSFEDYQWVIDALKTNETNIKLKGRYIVTAQDISFLDRLAYQELLEQDIIFGLRTLCKILYAFFNERVILLIDQYDRVMNTDLPKWDDMTKFVYKKVNAMISHALESHDFVYKALIFGTDTVLPLRESHSVLKHITHLSFLSKHRFSDYFGFSSKEMKKLFTKFRCTEDEKNTLKEFYNGYKFREDHEPLFNPRSVVQYFSHRVGNTTAFRIYWKEEGKFLQAILESNSIRKILRQLIIPNNTISFNLTTVYTERDYEIYYETKYNDMILTMLFDRGYLTPGFIKYQYMIPNEEIRMEIQQALHYFKVLARKKVNAKKVEEASLSIDSDGAFIVPINITENINGNRSSTTT